jgi:hypothetical protein
MLYKYYKWDMPHGFMTSDFSGHPSIGHPCASKRLRLRCSNCFRISALTPALSDLAIRRWSYSQAVDTLQTGRQIDRYRVNFRDGDGDVSNHVLF